MKYASMKVLFLVSAFMTGCGGVESRVRKGNLGEVIDQKPERRSYYEAIGIGGADPSLPTITQRKALSRDAAIVKAQYELLTLVKGVKLEGGLSVSKALAKDSELSARVNDVIRGAVVVKSEFTEDGGCVATLRLPKSALYAAVGSRP